MEFIDPPGGRPWALLGLCGASLALNLVLGVALLWPDREAPTPAAVAREAAAEADGVPASPIPPDAAPAGTASAESVDPAALAAQDPSSAGAAAVPDRPEGVRVAAATVARNLAYTFHQAIGDGSDALSATTARLFVWDLDLRRDLQKGDRVQVAWVVEDELPVILAARYTSRKLGRTLDGYRFQATGDAHPSYWTADGTEVPHRLVDGPLRGNYQQVTSLLKDRPTHAGMDFKTPVGTDVVTPRAGTVVRTDWNVAYNGNCAEVRWGDGTLARFLHLSETAVKAGQRLPAGARIGASGNTGRSTAPHLHYELERSGRTLDPVEVHGTIRRTLPEADRARFEAEVVRLSALLADPES